MLTPQAEEHRSGFVTRQVHVGSSWEIEGDVVPQILSDCRSTHGAIDIKMCLEKSILARELGARRLGWGCGQLSQSSFGRGCAVPAA